MVAEHAPTVVAILEVETHLYAFRRFQSAERRYGYEYVLWPGPIVRYETVGQKRLAVHINCIVAGARKGSANIRQHMLYLAHLLSWGCASCAYMVSPPMVNFV